MNSDRSVIRRMEDTPAWTAAVALFCVSFLLPTGAGHGGSWLPGFAAFLIGAIFCWHPWCWWWWANVLFFLALVRSAERATALSFVLAVLALLLAASVAFVAWPKVLGPAYWTWTGSMALLSAWLGLSLVPALEPFHEDEEWRSPRDFAARPVPGDERVKPAR